MLNRIIDYLKTPSSYRGNPYGYAFNQMGHVVIGAGLATWSPWLVLAYIAIIEIPQLVIWDGEMSDALEDTTYVLAGALGFFLISACFLLVGAVQRYEERNT